jgi:hypothetical protein
MHDDHDHERHPPMPSFPTSATTRMSGNHHLRQIKSIVATSSLHRIESIVAISSLRRIESAVTTSSLRRMWVRWPPPSAGSRRGRLLPLPDLGAAASSLRRILDTDLGRRQNNVFLFSKIVFS